MPTQPNHRETLVALPAAPAALTARGRTHGALMILGVLLITAAVGVVGTVPASSTEASTSTAANSTPSTTPTATTTRPASSYPWQAKAHPVLVKGDRGPAVRVVRRHFDMRGSIYGKNLKRKVVRMERRAGMRNDKGRITPRTWRLMDVPYRERAAKRMERVEARAKARAEARARARAKARARAARTPGTAAFGSRVMREAAKHRGKPYVLGGNGPGVFDCSGFTRYVYARMGKSLPRTAAQQRGATRRITRSQLRVGDLVFVHRGGYVGHVAIYAGRGTWWEARKPGVPLGKYRAWSGSVSYGRAR
jgi:cell wall-associated NlpC family hydrolase